MNCNIASNDSLVESWEQWFLNSKSAPFLNKSFKQRLFNTFNSAITNDECKNQMLKHDEVAFLFKMNFGQGRINILHHFQEIGGKLWMQEEYFGAIQGIKKDGTCVVIPDQHQLFGISEDNESIPETDSFLQVQDLNQLDQLIASNDKKYTARNVIPVPPFMLSKISDIIQEFSGDSKRILLGVIQCVREFDEENEALEEVEQAKISCQDLLSWLYLATKNKVYSVPMIACSDVTIQRHFQQLERSNLIGAQPRTTATTTNHVPEQQNISRPLEVIANSSNLTRDFMDKLTQLQSSNGEKQSKSFQKLAKNINE